MRPRTTGPTYDVVDEGPQGCSLDPVELDVPSGEF